MLIAVEWRALRSVATCKQLVTEIPHAEKPVGGEDHEERIQVGLCVTAKTLHDLEAKGNTVINAGITRHLLFRLPPCNPVGIHPIPGSAIQLNIICGKIRESLTYMNEHKENQRPSEQHIAFCSYLIWLQEGKPDGHEKNNWSRAEEQLNDCYVHDQWYSPTQTEAEVDQAHD